MNFSQIAACWKEKRNMINRKKLLAISELNLAGKIDTMEESKLANYVQLLNSFADNFPAREKKIKDALIGKDYQALTKQLTLVRDQLEKMYVEEMARDCTKRIGWIGIEKYEKTVVYVNYLLSILAIVANEIQKAQEEDEPSNADKDDADAETGDNPKKLFIEKLFEISELKLAGKIEKMEKEEIDNYLHLLNMFTEDYPEQEEQIREALKTKDKDAFVMQLSEIRNILVKMYAEEIAQDCAKQINLIGSTPPEKIEAYIDNFLSRLSMLSIDIQMAGIRSATQAPLQERHSVGKLNAGIRILAVDDTPFFLSILKKILSDSKYILTCVSSGEDALRYLEVYRPDIFLLDIEMQGMDGYQLAEKIKEIGQDAPIIFLTGNAKKEYLAKAVRVGAADFIIKPINKDVLIRKIDKYLS
jgi:CheY-like chemotaxis protein